MPALWFLARKQFFNSLRRAKGSPRLILPVAFFVFIFLIQVILPLALRFFLGNKAVSHAPHSYTPQAFVTGGPGTLLASVRGLLFLSIMSAVIAALGEGGAAGLALSPSDVDYLFPAPLPRRHVLFFKLLTRWAGLVLPAVYLPLALASTAVRLRDAPSPLAYWPGMVGVWLFMVTVNNVTQTISLGKLQNDAPLAEDAPEGSQAARDYEAGLQKRESAKRVVIALVWVVLAAFVYLVVGGLHGLFDTDRTHATPANIVHDAAVQTFLQAANGKAVGVLLAPLAWASDLFGIAFRGWAWADAGRIAGLLVLFAGSVVLLFSRDRDFYESAVDTTAKTARMTQALRQGDAGTVLSQMAQDGRLGKNRHAVRPLGSGAGAILWKDLVGITRTPLRSWTTLLIVAAFPAIFGLLFGRKSSEAGVVSWMVTFTIQISGFFLLGMRDMMRRADLSKALPIAPLPFIAAELAASIVIQTALGWFSLTLTGLVGMGFGPVVLAAYFVFPTLAALVLWTQAAFVLLYPPKQSDIAQNQVGAFLGLLASVVAVLPSLLVGVVLYFAKVPTLFLGGTVCLVNLICAGIALFAAASLWRHFDPTGG